MPKNFEKGFERLSDFVSGIVGSPYWFAWSLGVIILWFPSRFIFPTEELWHLFINTFTTILTFLMMALLHSSQSKWEKDIEQLEKKQEKILKLLEKDMAEIKTTLITQNAIPETEKSQKKQNDKNKKNPTITSLL